jgi:hypothetical protein
MSTIVVYFSCLAVSRAAINAYHTEYVLSVVPKVTLPTKSDRRHRWLTRNEAARLLGAAMGYVWDGEAERRTWKRREDGTLLRRERWIIRRRQPAARFILIGLYSARREETIRRTQWVATMTHPWMNLDGWSISAAAPPRLAPKSGDLPQRSPHGCGCTSCGGARWMRSARPNYARPA